MVQLFERLKLRAQEEQNHDSGKSISQKKVELFSQIDLMFSNNK